MKPAPHSPIRYLGLIPARGGSKRVPGKNLRPLHGKPLITWTIDAALATTCLDHVAVSTDCPDIAQTARQAGAEVPFIRPEALATDQAASIDVILHAVAFYESQGHQVDNVVLLQPTSPLRHQQDIAAAINTYESLNATAVISVCALEHPKDWAHPLTNAGTMDHFAAYLKTPKISQDHTPCYRLNGAIYIAAVATLRQHRGFFAPTGVYPYIMPHERSVDIDSPTDFAYAAFLSQQGSSISPNQPPPEQLR